MKFTSWKSEVFRVSRTSRFHSTPLVIEKLETDYESKRYKVLNITHGEKHNSRRRRVLYGGGYRSTNVALEVKGNGVVSGVTKTVNYILVCQLTVRYIRSKLFWN